jgi:hypothetical protein
MQASVCVSGTGEARYLAIQRSRGCPPARGPQGALRPEMLIDGTLCHIRIFVGRSDKRPKGPLLYDLHPGLGEARHRDGCDAASVR